MAFMKFAFSHVHPLGNEGLLKPCVREESWHESFSHVLMAALQVTASGISDLQPIACS